MTPKGYEDYLENGVRTKEIEMDHLSETLKIVKMTRKYNTAQLAERVGFPRTSIWSYLEKIHYIRPIFKFNLMQNLKTLLKEEKQINKKVHGRAYL